MTSSMPSSTMTVAEVLERWPETVEVFQHYKTACVGCVMAPFDTLVDVAQIYKLELDNLMGDLQLAVSQNGRPDPRADS